MFLTNPAKAETTIQKNMPKSFYLNESDIPADQKGCYENKNGRWQLTNLESDHPVIATKTSLETTNAQLKTTNDSLTVQVTNLEREKIELSTKSVPHGYRAVPKEVAELGETAKAEGFSKEELPQVKTKLTDLETKEIARADREIKTRALKAVGVTDVDGFFELKRSDALKIEAETVDGKEKFYVVEETNGVKEKKVFDTEYLKNTEGFKNSFDSLTKPKEESSGFHFGEQSGEKGKNIYDQIRESAKAEAETTKSSTDLDARFGKSA
ncbi:MAG TPA: hypothetical protein PKY82_29500 [Pyrinomonadaceae bacterium]|nr:hypothetical protein [Pyrinomonadaceae bacterium]